MSALDNAERARRGANMLEAYRVIYAPEDGPRTNLVDLLTDLRHVCDMEQIDYSAADGMALLHFEAEKKGGNMSNFRPWNSIERASPGPLTGEQVRQTVEAIRVLLKRAPGATGWVIRLVALANGTRSADEGKYLQDYDAGRGTYIATTEAASAKHFPDLSAVHEYVRQSAGLRPDGKPNRPLTAWTIEVLRD